MTLPHADQPMSLIVRTVCSGLKAFILLYGIQVIFYGHLTPGGGFAGGVIAASAFVLVVLAEGQQQGLRTFSRKAASVFDCLGVLGFLLLATLGLLLASVFFLNVWGTRESAWFTLFSSGIVLPSNLGIGLKVCSSIYLVFLALAALHFTAKTESENVVVRSANQTGRGAISDTREDDGDSP